MAKLLGVRQQRVQFFYDTDFLVTGVSTGIDLARSQKQLFASASIGDLTRSNMPSPGYLSGDQTFLTYAVRHEIGFYHFLTASGLPAPFTDLATLHWATLHSSTFRYQVGEKVEFEGPVTMTPAGGGPWGMVNDPDNPMLTNGAPENKAIYVLPLPIAVSKRQGIRVEELKNSISGTTTMDVVSAINTFTGFKAFRCYIDGFNTRDVQ
jgi:hypothetical protein